jgi:5-methyltetrahydrofolate--homocysteine methyltransferase
MTSLLYRPDADLVRDRLTRWWHGEHLGRPVIQLTAPREVPLEPPAVVPEPAGWVTSLSTRDMAYRLFVARDTCARNWYLGDAIPTVNPYIAPNALALFLGCPGIEGPGTVWCEPVDQEPEVACATYDRDNFYWRWVLSYCQALQQAGAGRFLIGFTDLIEGLDTLSALRDNHLLLFDLVERPEWVHALLRQITDRYFYYYDVLYDLIRDERGGSCYWIWAPGRLAKFQCDFSAMISPRMFGEFMLPVLEEMFARVSYNLYHWDGPGAICHQELLLSLERLRMLQWTPGAGIEPADHPRWWPLFHKTFAAGKRVMIGCEGLDSLLALRQEFGDQWGWFVLNMHADSLEEAHAILQVVHL